MKMEYRSILNYVGKRVASTDTGKNSTKGVEKKTDKNSVMNLKNRG